MCILYNLLMYEDFRLLLHDTMESTGYTFYKIFHFQGSRRNFVGVRRCMGVKGHGRSTAYKRKCFVYTRISQSLFFFFFPSLVHSLCSCQTLPCCRCEHGVVPRVRHGHSVSSLPSLHTYLISSILSAGRVSRATCCSFVDGHSFHPMSTVMFLRTISHHLLLSILEK